MSMQLPRFKDILETTKGPFEGNCGAFLIVCFFHGMEWCLQIIRDKRELVRSFKVRTLQDFNHGRKCPAVIIKHDAACESNTVWEMERLALERLQASSRMCPFPSARPNLMLAPGSDWSAVHESRTT
jgi:hypothetical protein